MSRVHAFMSRALFAVGCLVMGHAVVASDITTSVKVGKLGKACHLKGLSETLRCLDVTVPMFHEQQGTKEELHLHVAIAPAIKENARPDPLFVLAGGPGQAGSDILYLTETALRQVRQQRDLVFIDQRGTGRSGQLKCPGYDQLMDVSPAEQDQVMYRCVQQIPGDRRAYNTRESAHDLDRIRQHLGYAHINVWGGSYGTRLAQAYARLYPDTTRSLILDSIASPEQVLGAWGADAQASLDAVFRYCETEKSCAAAFPDLAQKWQTLQHQFESNTRQIDYIHPRTGELRRDVLRYDGFTESIRMQLYSTRGMSQLPLIISRAASDDFAPFMQVALAGTDWATQSMAFGMTLSVVCAEDMPRLSSALLEQEKAYPFLRGINIQTWQSYCSLMKATHHESLDSSVMNTPALLLAGALDPVTPPSRAEQALQHITHGQLLIAPHVSHIVGMSGCAPKLMADFLQSPDKKIDGTCLNDIPFPTFALSNAGVAP